jgi:hypothetical protein
MRPGKLSAGDCFKPFSAASRTTAERACDYTEWPEVTAAFQAPRGDNKSTNVRMLQPETSWLGIALVSSSLIGMPYLQHPRATSSSSR